MRPWRDEEDKDVGGFLDPEVGVESSVSVERLRDQGHVTGPAVGGVELDTLQFGDVIGAA